MKILNVGAFTFAATIAAVVPGSATTLQPPGLVSSSAQMGGVHRPRTATLITRSGLRVVESVNGPSGCIVNQSPNFIGIGKLSNYAGQWSGVMSGASNEACDQASVVNGGLSNIVGGDGDSPYGAIVAGYANEIEGERGFIGSGLQNLVGYIPGTSQGSNDSSIVSGQDNTIAGLYSFIGSGLQNLILSPSGVVLYASFIGGGTQNTISGPYSSIVSGQSNGISGMESSINSGSSNQITGDDASIVGGVTNRVATQYSFIGGGQSNQILGPLGLYAAVSGGYSNLVNAEYGAVGGGQSNSVTGEYGAIFGGYDNSSSGAYATIAGGYQNSASGAQAAVSGGYHNVASGKNAAIPGGTTNVASATNTFAAGTKSTAGYSGSFVWSDYVSGANGVSATGANQFLARATGGFYLYSSTSLTGVALAPGSGAWSTLSDRRVKTGIADVDDARILAKLAALPVSTWSYKAQGSGVRHIGPMAQDFRAAFGLGEDDRHISTVDEEGVALAAIKALAVGNATKDREIASLRAEKDRQIAELRSADEAKFAALEKRLATLESRAPLQQNQAKTHRHA